MGEGSAETGADNGGRESPSLTESAALGETDMGSESQGDGALELICATRINHSWWLKENIYCGWELRF